MTHSWTCLFLLATPATIIRRCACSALSFESALLAALWSSNCSRASRRCIFKFTHYNLSAISLLVTDFTFLEERDSYIVGKSWRLSTPTVTESNHLYLRDRTAGKNYQHLTPEWIRLLIMDVISIMAMYYIQSWKLYYIARHHLLLQSIASGLRQLFIGGLIDRKLLFSLSYDARH